MNANAVRVYTILPPAFYTALEAHNQQAAQPLWLIQEVWITDHAEDLYDPAVEGEFATDVERVIDLLHGQGDVPYRPGQPVRPLRGRRVALGDRPGRRARGRTEPRAADQRAPPRAHVVCRASRPPRAGQPDRSLVCPHVRPRGRVRDEPVYNAQRPITVVSWPPLDPLDASHRGDVPRGDRAAAGGGASPCRRTPSCSPTSATTPTWSRWTSRASARGRRSPAGLFALYHVYQHWPDFLFHEPAFAQARDDEGPNRYLGYLQALKRVHPNMPLLIGEYGVATSVGVAHLHPDGWHNGGFTERDASRRADALHAQPPGGPGRREHRLCVEGRVVEEGRRQLHRRRSRSRASATRSGSTCWTRRKPSAWSPTSRSTGAPPACA